MARGDSGTTTDDDESHWYDDWELVQMTIIMLLVLLSSIPYFIGMYKNPPLKDGRKGSGKQD